MRLVYYGTPALAVPPLQRLVKDGRAPRLVVTQRDRPKGRGLKTGASPVRAAADSLALTVVTPARAGAPEELDRLRAVEPDLIVLVAYGQILPRELLEIPRLGALNVHFSLLPRHRGASPIQAALLAGDRETGVTSMWMTEGLDEGPTFLALSTPIGEEEDAGELGARLAALGAQCLAMSLDRIERGDTTRTAQDSSRATYAPKIPPGAGRLSLELPAEEAVRRVRALTPEPGAYFELSRGRLLVTAAAPGGMGNSPLHASAPAVAPGDVLAVDSAQGLEIALSRGSLWLRRVRPSGRSGMSGSEYANGARLKPGDRLSLLPGAP